MSSLADIVAKHKPIEKHKGFLRPTTTPVPDVLIDQLMTTLTHAELKIMLYISRRTLGFFKKKQTISLTQIASGFVTPDGIKRDGGAGIDRTTAARVLKTLEAKGLIVVQRSNDARGARKNTYALRFSTEK